MCAVHEDLKPKLIEEYNDPFELLVVEIEAKSKAIRVITGCGPQENWEEGKRISFFIALEAEIVKAELAGTSIVIEMDANAKLGQQYIPNDTYNISPNGRLLANILERHALIVANGSTKCTGRVTRKRVTKDRTEESSIDLVIFSTDLNSQFRSLLIDEERKHVLTKIRKTKNGTVKKESDHNVLLTDFEMTLDANNNKKVELYNLKNPECQDIFRKYTSNTKMLSSVFNSDDNLNILTNRFIKKLDGCIKHCFKKVRVSNNKPSDASKLYDKMRELKGKQDEESKKELEKVIEAIAEHAEGNYRKVTTELNTMNPEGGKINTQKFWKLKKKICPKSRDPPAAMFSSKGDLLTNKKDIEERAVEVYTDRLKPNKIVEHLESYEETENKLCELRLKISKLNKTEPWTNEDLEQVIKDLDKDKSRDAIGHANEIFKCAGCDLKLAVLRLMNHIKSKHELPEVLQYCNITSIYKHKGSHKDFNNYRGVFRVTVLRSVLDRLIYNDSYSTIDEHLTDGNVGARKNRNIRDNLFVLGAVINSVINGKEPPIQVQVQDVEKCFDKMWLQATTNALYDAGLKCDMLNLLHNENVKAKIAVKVNGGISRRVVVNNVEMQGSVWASLKCTTSMDTLNKTILEQDHLTYKYRGDPNIQIGVMGMVDDNLSISNCGMSTVQKNAVINSFIETQRLTLSKSKSVVIHVGKASKCKQSCPTLKVHNHIMKTVQSQRYLGDIITATGTQRETVEDRRNSGWGKLSEITGILSELPQVRKVEVGLKLREAKIVNGMIYSTEAWSSLSDKELTRMEQVDMACLRSLVKGHSKCSVAFITLEFGLLQLRHRIMIRRMMYHHHILSRNNEELVKKIYQRQKEDSIKGDWIRTLQSDLNFIGEDMDDQHIVRMSKVEYKSYIQKKIEKASFQYYLSLKEKCKKKLQDLKYDRLRTQDYLINGQFSQEEINLLFALRSKSYAAKMNFRKMNRGDLKCVFQCGQLETQSHIFENCKPIQNQLNYIPTMKIENIYGTVSQQKEAISVFIRIDHMRNLMKSDILPGL